MYILLFNSYVKLHGKITRTTEIGLLTKVATRGTFCTHPVDR